MARLEDEFGHLLIRGASPLAAEDLQAQRDASARGSKEEEQGGEREQRGMRSGGGGLREREGEPRRAAGGEEAKEGGGLRELGWGAAASPRQGNQAAGARASGESFGRRREAGACSWRAGGAR